MTDRLHPAQPSLMPSVCICGRAVTDIVHGYGPATDTVSPLRQTDRLPDGAPLRPVIDVDREPRVSPDPYAPGLTRQQRVLAYLRGAGDWVYGPELANASIGGSEGLRRLRELREQGWIIEERRRPGRQGWEYKLIGYAR